MTALIPKQNKNGNLQKLEVIGICFYRGTNGWKVVFSIFHRIFMTSEDQDAFTRRKAIS